MKIIVIGGTGLIGSKVVSILAEQGHEAVPAAPSIGQRAPGPPRRSGARFAPFAGLWTAVIIKDRLHHYDFAPVTRHVGVVMLP
jgi:uncharacterized protein YbjT (DUF2867 family)